MCDGGMAEPASGEPKAAATPAQDDGEDEDLFSMLNSASRRLSQQQQQQQPAAAAAADADEEGDDLFSILNRVQSSRLDMQRSSVGPTDLSPIRAPPPAASAPGSVAGSFEEDGFPAATPETKRKGMARIGGVLKRLSKREMVAEMPTPPLSAACQYFSDSRDAMVPPERVREVNQSAGHSGGTNRLVVRAAGWLTEVAPFAQPLVIGPATTPDANLFEELDPGCRFYSEHFYGQGREREREREKKKKKKNKKKKKKKKKKKRNKKSWHGL